MSASESSGRPLVYRETSAASTGRRDALSGPSDGKAPDRPAGFYVLVGEDGRCGCCLGTGEHRCGHECGSCDGSGRNPDSPVCRPPHGADCTCTADRDVPDALKRLIPDEQIEAGLAEIHATVTVLTAAQAAEMRRLHRTRSIECGAMTTTLMCRGCDGAAMDGRGDCLHDCHAKQDGDGRDQ